MENQGFEQDIASALGTKIVDDSVKEDVPQEETTQKEQPQENKTEVSNNEQSESSLHNKKTESTSETDSPKPSTDFNLQSLNEKLGSKFGSIDDLKEKLNSSSNVNFANEKIAKINEYVKETGRSVEDYFSTQLLDVEKLTDIDVVKSKLSADNPDLSKEEVEILFKDSYGSGEKGEDGKPSVQSIRLKRDATEARKGLNDLKEKYLKPEEGKVSPQQRSELRKKWVSDMQEETSQLEAIEFDIGSGDNKQAFQFKIDNAGREKLIENNKNLGEKFFSRYIKEGGKWDYDKLNVEMYMLDNIDTIVNSAVAKFSNQKSENVIRDIKNTNFNPQETSGGEKQKNIMSQIQDQIFGDM